MLWSIGTCFRCNWSC